MPHGGHVPNSRRGGRRPGAGAPRGNLNALKHGRSSYRFQQLLLALAEVPEVRELLLTYHRRHQRKVRRARRIARTVFSQLLPHLPPRQDHQINQTIDHLPHPVPSPTNPQASQKIANNNQLSRENNQPSLSLSKR